MSLPNANPVVLGVSNNRALDRITLASVDFIPTPEQIAAQAASFIARRYNVSLTRARIICDLTGIGRAAA